MDKMLLRYSKLIKLHSNHKSCFVEVNWILARKTEKEKGSSWRHFLTVTPGTA